MAEKIVSPGVFTNEIDASFLPAAIGDIGAALIGPTVKGPHLVPTVVESYAEYQALFGDSFKSGSQYYTYFTSIAAKNYLQHAGRLTVVRVAGAGITNASASISTTEDATTGNTATGSGTITGWADGGILYVTSSAGSYQFRAVDSPVPTDDENDNIYYFLGVGGTVAHSIASASAKIGTVSAITETFLATATTLQMTASTGGTGGNSLGFNSASVDTTLTGGTAGTTNTAFELHTLADGTIMNNSGSVGTNDALGSATKDSVRWEIPNSNYKKGTFTLVIRGGKDTSKRKNPLETWNDLSLDPTSNNYIESRLGNQYNTIATDGTTTYLQPTGEFANKSKYIRVASVTQTPDYLDENGAVTYTNSGSLLPATGTGTLKGAFQGGNDGVKTSGAHKFYGDATDADGWQGLNLTAASETGSEQFVKALNLLANDDEYDINMILMPGVSNDIASHLVSKAVDTAESRGDTFYLADPVKKGAMIAAATEAAETYDSNYTAMYWPWVQVNEPQIGRNVWVPPSAMMCGVIAFNDKVAFEWFAPAGLNRGGLDTAIQAERKLTHANRDTLYESSVNPLATFPGEGVVCWGQKTLQKKSSALDRVNVRRLMIKVKKFIAASSRFLVFEQNNAATRTRFLNIANPFLESVQQNSGLSAFKVIMDDTNNTPDLVDRNVLYGQIFLQPTRTAEFIVLDFTVMPTGATFPE